MEFIALLVALIAIFMVRSQGKRILRLEQHLAALVGARPEAAASGSPPLPAPQTSPLEVFARKSDASTPPAPQPAPSLAREQTEDIKADAVTPPAVPPSPPAPPTEEVAPVKSFEERFGASWVVWIGGIALALGGIFLVQYSIEAGLIGPGVRIVLGALFAAALIGAGEWARRREIGGNPLYAENAHIPSIFTAAGTTVAYAVIYAAYGLYEFIGPATAFVLLGIVALATLAASLLHGPWLAALGQVGAFVAPLLVASNVPNYWALYIYLGVVIASSFLLARVRMWRWLVLTAVAFGTLWLLVGIDDLRVDTVTPHVFHVVVSFALAAALIVSGLFYGPDSEPGEIDFVSTIALVASIAGAAVLVLAFRHDAVALSAFTLLVFATIAIAWRTDAAVAAVPFAGALAFLVVGTWMFDIQWQNLIAPGGLTAGLANEPRQALYGPQLTLGFAYAALFAAAGFLAQGRSPRPEAPIIWAATAAIVPLAMLIALYYRIYGFDRALPFAAIALLVAALFAVATEILGKREPRPGQPSATAIFATGSIAALALALTFALEKGWLTVALALMVPGIAWVAEQRPLPWLRSLAAIVTGLVMLRIGYEPRIMPGVDATPIFNWILYGYGVPAIAFWVAGWLLRRRADDYSSRVVDAAAILFSARCFTLEVRHYIYSGDIYRPSAGLTELALNVIGALAMAIGLEHIRGRTKSIVHEMAATVIALAALVAIVLGLLILRNPWLNNTDVGGVLFNLNLLGYAIPAALAAMLGLMTRRTRPHGYSIAAAVTSVVLALFYLSFQVARIYQGARISAGPVSGAEGYTYSAVWLAFGVALLIVGIALRSQPVRLCSAAVVLATVIKVFLLDLAGLTGVWRALSFIGLGLVLMGIGYLYQRLLFTKKPPPVTETSVTPA